MAKKSAKKVQQTQKKVLPKRITKQKNKPLKEEQVPESDQQPDSMGSNSSEFFESDSDMGDSQQSQENSEESSSISSVKPQNYAIKQMTFRSRRGTKMQQLMKRKKQEEDDPFWVDQGANYFGNLDDGDEDEEQYSQSSSGKDMFDSDFGQTESQHDEEEEQKKFHDDDDEKKEREKRKRTQLMKQINSRTTPVQTKTKPKAQKVEKPEEEVGNRYIHQLFTQQQLLGEAAHTEYENWLSLKQLISIETEKKDFTRKEKHIDGDKIIYRDKLKEDGAREVTYELSGVNVERVQDLTDYWNAN